MPPPNKRPPCSFQDRGEQRPAVFQCPDFAVGAAELLEDFLVVFALVGGDLLGPAAVMLTEVPWRRGDGDGASVAVGGSGE